ncbi:MAG TPA: SMP-30/gluconolactonase/LRE family protein [Polyangia bacterium]|nr:SMP-30/gluconolactonase/LRE family protein [Polyangia bacterium]
MTKVGGAQRVASIAAGLSAVLSVGANALAAPPGKPEQPTVVVSFNPALGQLPESITSDPNGNLYASNVSGAIQKIDPQTGTFETVATVPLPTGAQTTGIKVGPDGLIYVMSSSFSPSPAGAFMWRVSPCTGAVEQFASFDPNGFPNDLVFQDDGSIIVTDPFLAQLWKVDTTGNVSVFLADPLFAGDPTAPAFSVHTFGVDGIAWDHNKRNLFVSTLDFGRVMSIPMGGQGKPPINIIVEDPALKGVDGIAVDRRGTIWCAVNTQDRIATVDKGGAISVIAQGAPLDGPSSFAFGTGQGEKQTLYIANFAIGSFLSGQTAHPGILSIPAPVPGLPLP